MQMKHLSLAAFVAAAAAQQNLRDTLAGNEATSNLTTFLGMFPDLLNQLNEAENITILAPSNEAFSALLEGDAGEMIRSDTGMIQALLQYHVLSGTFPASSVTNMSAFIPTMLMNETYANVTDGQVVEAVAVQDKVLFFSGLLANSTVTQAVSACPYTFHLSS